MRIGATICEDLADAGCDVVIHHRKSHDEAMALAKRLEDRGVRAWATHYDLADATHADRVVDAARGLAGRVDILVNNASVYPQETLAQTDDALFHETLAVNAWSPLALTRAFAEDAPEGACVVNVLDTHVHRVTREKFAYQLSKRALLWFTRATALELAPRVRVNGVSPGAILPPPGGDEAYLRRLGERLPLRRHGSPQDVAQAVRYLCTAPFVTGVTIEVDGGEALQGRLPDE